jgi:iron complex outermembrane receptor protein
MKLKLKSMPFAISCAIAGGALSMMALTPAMAQQPEGQAIQRVVVTGSLISRTDKETPSPIQVLSADDLAKSGYTSVAEVLSNLASNGQGALGTGFAGAFANGGAGVSLRGLTVGLTLVLIDGHRMAPYPLSDDAQRQFVDVSSIPFDAIDRIEVLKDGASSMYGSDAIAGVVNVILKKSFNGTSIKTDVGNSRHGGGKNFKVALTSGFGDLDNDGWNAFGSAEYRHADAIKLHQRDNNVWANGDWRSRGGNDLRRGMPTASNSFLTAASSPFFYNPTGAGGANNADNLQFLDSNCNFDLYRAGGCMVRDTVSFLQPESHNVNLLAGFTKKLGNDWQLALKASMFKRNSVNNRGVPATFSPASFTGNTALVPGQAPQIVNVYGSTEFPANYPLNQLGAPARLYGYIPGLDPANTQDNTSTATRFVADLTGSFMGWDVAAAAGITDVKTATDYSGYVNRFALYQSLNNADAAQRFNPLGGNSAALMNTVSPRFSKEASSKLNFIELQGQREIFQLPGGPLNLATGVSWRKKELNAPSATLLQTGVAGGGTAYSSGDETNTAVFASWAATSSRAWN